MSDPHVYPESPDAPLSLPAAVGMPAPTFTPIEQLAAPDPSTPDIPKTMFIRIAMSGADCLGVNSTTAPNFYLKADTGDVVLINDHTQPPNLTHAIFRTPGSNPAEFIGEGSVFLESHNVFRLIIAFDDGAGEHAWQLGIWNNDIAQPRQFTWVVSGTLVATLQPWIDVAPATLEWDLISGSAEAKGLTISNKGTSAFTVTGVTPALPSGFELALPGVINPNASAPVVVRFTAPATSPPGGVVAASASFDVTPPDSGAGEAAGHNRQVSLRARVPLPNSWTIKAPMPTGRTRLGLAAASNGKLYAVGGAVPGNPAFRTLEEYDPATNTWTTKAPMPTARTALCLAAVGDGLLYAVGGTDMNATATEFPRFAIVEAYDPVTDSWSTKAPMLTARSDFGLAACNGKLYAAGGLDANLNDLAALEEYDPTTNSWTTRAPMPQRRIMSGLVAAANGRLYAFGGLLNSIGDTAPTVDEYDPATDTWVTKAHAPTLRSRIEVAMAVNGRIYVTGGVDRFTSVATVEEYNPATNVWTARAPMPLAVSWHSVATAGNGKLYSVGGELAQGSDRNKVQEYTPGR